MPIRFRCDYCNQLLGISRRKAGTIVRCTTCEWQLIVPDPSDAATEGAGPNEPVPQPDGDDAPKTEAASRQPEVASGGVFEGSDFDAFLEPLNGGGAGPAVASPPAPSSKRSAPSSVSAPARLPAPAP